MPSLEAFMASLRSPTWVQSLLSVSTVFGLEMLGCEAIELHGRRAVYLSIIYTVKDLLIATNIMPTTRSDYITTRCYHAPTASMLGIYPSLRFLSNLLISSTDVALAMACFTFSASSFDISRPAFAEGTASLGSSVVTVVFECVDTVVDIVVANAVGRPSAVRNRD